MTEPKMPDRFKDGTYRVNLAEGAHADIVIRGRRVIELDPILRPGWNAEKAIRLMGMATFIPFRA